jgi:hypothetical protein
MIVGADITTRGMKTDSMVFYPDELSSGTGSVIDAGTMCFPELHSAASKLAIQPAWAEATTALLATTRVNRPALMPATG